MREAFWLGLVAVGIAIQVFILRAGLSPVERELRRVVAELEIFNRREEERIDGGEVESA